MHTIFLLLVSVAGLGHCQDPHYQESPRNAAILSDTRYLSGDGTFGASYKQEDGVEFKEESDEFGNRRGSYSYIDPNGERRTVTYTAGKNGFQASGDHIPTAPPQIPPEPVQPEYVPLPQYNPPDYQFPKERFYDSRFQTQNQYEPQIVEAPKKVEPKITFQYEYHHDPNSVKYQSPTAEFESQYQLQPYQQRKYQPAPPPRPAQYHQSSQPSHELQSQAFNYQTPQYVPSHYQKSYNSGPYRSPAPVSEYRPLSKPQSHYNQITTPAPRRFYPPGKLDFNRTPDGFSYSFSKT
ncbi:early nodulin-75 [Leptopilina heterotoma]|uniref:early nodulin-75 n=1 Tax=Leptopilina heterotoma TaxID=63436 RepID=UPI001CA93524|nr:early nodulin-75 [Leptopilina heterotoma]